MLFHNVLGRGGCEVGWWRGLIVRQFDKTQTEGGGTLSPSHMVDL